MNPFTLAKKQDLLSISTKLSTYVAINEIKNNSFKIVESIKKTDFAFDLLSNQDDWNTPTYIKEGLLWLSQQ